jgi:hypothetical protein
MIALSAPVPKPATTLDQNRNPQEGESAATSEAPA